MSSNARPTPEVNLEEFERRLRAAGSPQAQAEDPLEELTRLIQTIDQERQRDASPTQLESASPPSESDAPLLRPTLDDATPDPETIAEIDPAPPVEPPPAAPRKTAVRGVSWYVKVGGLVGVAAVLVAGAVAVKFGGVEGVGGPKAPPTILAADTPNKVAPPSDKAVQSPTDNGALLSKDSPTNAPVKVINTQEQPVALNPPADNVVAPTENTPIVATPPGPTIQPPPAAPALSPKKPIKTVSVRPDGSLIIPAAAPSPDAAAQVAPVVTPSVKPAPPTVNVQPASPTLDLPTPKPAKTSTRAPVAKTDTTAPAEPVNAPLQLAPAKPAKPKPAAEPQPAADAGEPPPAPAAGSGDFAVQLAAPRSEADARNSIQKLQTKWAEQLGDVSIGVRKAERDGETVYRVRTAGMSRADAKALCDKIKADGGDCFVAKNQ